MAVDTSRVRLPAKLRARQRFSSRIERLLKESSLLIQYLFNSPAPTLGGDSNSVGLKGTMHSNRRICPAWPSSAVCLFVLAVLLGLLVIGRNSAEAALQFDV